MKEERHVIWSNYGLDYEDWRWNLEADYPVYPKMSAFPCV